MNKTAEGELLNDDLSNYDKDAYEKPSVTVDVAICTIIDDELKVLLIKRKHPPFRNSWAIPGGFLEVEKKFVYFSDCVSSTFGVFSSLNLRNQWRAKRHTVSAKYPIAISFHSNPIEAPCITPKRASKNVMDA